MSGADWVVLGLLACGVFFAVRQIRRGGGCAGGCSGCPRSGDCKKEE